ncbi:hypothetical protein WQ57_07065 [Mesobacillus campisalis]|uniref:YetF C-terminal domain-containing protein n=1 Tax=Mesobacillus campisalis TaxID=1408103 RepID=A0A0M2SYF5_9BACI|nr:DUF421 domain-containing protein [Mesobacillus campisalis]KKK38741.1 hypothetical protein WQ57_07065 [Mesobacillus campisalis]
MDSIKVIGRIITILPFLLFLGLYMGKRSIGELPVFDFLVVLVMGAVVGADIADPAINHIHTVVAMIAIALLQKLIIFLKMRYRKFGRLVTFEPTVVIYKGELLVKNLKKINYSIDNVLQMLREKDVFAMKDVDLAIIEANGRMSVNLVPDKQRVTLSHIGKEPDATQYEIPVILDGELQQDAIKKLGKSDQWVRQQLADQWAAAETAVFYAGISTAGDLNITMKGAVKKDVPPIYH